MLKYMVGCQFWPFARPGPRRPLARYRTVIPRSSATHTQIFSLLPCRWAGFLFLAPWSAPWLFSSNAHENCHSHALRYPHANFQPPSMSLGWIFILGVLAPWSAPLAFFAKRTHNLSFPCPPLPTCKFSAS